MLANISLTPMSTYWGTCHHMGKSAAKYTTFPMVWLMVFSFTRSSRLLSKIPGIHKSSCPLRFAIKPKNKTSAAGCSGSVPRTHVRPTVSTVA